jgi:hypothetical protein
MSANDQKYPAAISPQSRRPNRNYRALIDSRPISDTRSVDEIVWPAFPSAE